MVETLVGRLKRKFSGSGSQEEEDCDSQPPTMVDLIGRLKRKFSSSGSQEQEYQRPDFVVLRKHTEVKVTAVRECSCGLHLDEELTTYENIDSSQKLKKVQQQLKSLCEYNQEITEIDYADRISKVKKDLSKVVNEGDLHQLKYISERVNILKKNLRKVTKKRKKAKKKKEKNPAKYYGKLTPNQLKLELGL